MSEEYDNSESNVYYSPFWPLVILLAGFIIWLSYNVYEINAQRTVLNEQFQNAIPTINQAQAAQTRLVALMKDLVQTSDKNPYAKQILKEAIDAGMIKVTPNGTNAAGTPAAPAATTSSN